MQQNVYVGIAEVGIQGRDDWLAEAIQPSCSNGTIFLFKGGVKNAEGSRWYHNICAARGWATPDPTANKFKKRPRSCVDRLQVPTSRRTFELSRLDDEQPSGSAETTTGPAPPYVHLTSLT